MKDWEGKHGNSSNNLARSQVQTTWHEARAGLGGQVHERIEVQRVGGEWGEKMA
jgi:hypothetical protein